MTAFGNAVDAQLNGTIDGDLAERYGLAYTVALSISTAPELLGRHNSLSPLAPSAHCAGKTSGRNFRGDWLRIVAVTGRVIEYSDGPSRTSRLYRSRQEGDVCR
jgi:hypothetical protein